MEENDKRINNLLINCLENGKSGELDYNQGASKDLVRSETMKIKKRTAMMISFALGTLLLATSALADINSKSGYDQLKDALKLTAGNCSNKFTSFTMDLSIEVKDNGKTVSAEDSVQKYDMSKKSSESISSTEQYGRKSSTYRYNDPTTAIYHNTGDGQDDVYHVVQFSGSTKTPLFDDPFKHNKTEDLEKIADALVGSLKDYVVVKDNPDGSRELSGTLTEVQIPPLVNALASFEVKQMYRPDPNPNQAPPLIKDIYVKEVKGTAEIDKAGVMESILGTAVLSGKDEKGQVHELTLQLLGKLTGINSTKVTKPDLTGKKVTKEYSAGQQTTPGISNPQKFIGTFKNNILIEKDGKYVKIGERIIDITQIDNKTVSGRYHEEYKPGFEQYAADKKDFKFTAKFNGNQPNKDPQGADFTVPGSNIQCSLHFDEGLGEIYFMINNKMENSFNSQFNMEIK